MPGHDEAPPFDLDALLRDAAEQAVAHEDSERFVAWLRERLPMYWLAPESPGPGMATLLARTLWNAMPLPGNDLAPRPFDPPTRNAPCPCGSGRKYKHCCRDVEAEAPPLPTTMLYPYVAEQLASTEIERLLARSAAPVDFALVLADRAEEQGQPLKAARSLEPLFQNQTPLKRANLDLALSRLVDLYNELGYTNKKERLLAWIIAEAPAGSVRAEAWSRHAAIALDRGDREQGKAAFQQAQRDAPDDPSHGPREIVMLLSSGELDLARERASFWRRRLERAGYDIDQPPLNLVAEAVNDPAGAMLSLADDHAGVSSDPLRRWADTLHSQQLDAPTIEPIDEGSDTGEPAAGIVQPAPAVAQVEDDWWALLEALPGAASEDFAAWWHEDHLSRVSEWLNAHSLTASSFRVLDDLVSAAQCHPGATAAPPGIDALTRPLLERAHDLLASTTRTAANVTLPWRALENRPALYCLLELGFLEQRTGNRERARDLFAWLIALNPHDNHGIRGELISLYLELGQDQRALDLAEAYPEDLLAATRFGRVLALYRLGRQREARDAALTAHAALPLVRDYLVRKRVREPAIDGFGFSVGGADQAWLYREQARPLWAATSGALAWLQRTLPAGGR